MRIKPVALAARAVLAGLLWAAPPASAAVAGQRHGGGWTSEQRWGPKNDWEPNIAADPSSSWLYQMTTRYGGPSMCRPHMEHCIRFRSSADRGRTWHKSVVMSGWKCPPDRACSRTTWQNDPVLAVSTSGVIYAAWMNNWSVVFARSSDHGRTWSGFHNFRRALRKSWTDKPWIAISPDGRDVYVAFNRSDSYISASHDYGRSWSRPVRTNKGHRYWFAEGGAVAPDGHVYFAESAEHQNAKGTVRLAVISSGDGGASWTTTYVARSQQQPHCPVADCPNDFYGPQISLAIDRRGTILAAYVANTTARAPMRLYAITSADGRSWSAPTRLGSHGTKIGADFPAVAAGPRPGDFRVACEDDRNGAKAWNVWYRTTANLGASWSPAVRVSNRGSGAPYKTDAGFRFPYGDYFGITVDSHGTSYLAWSEGTSYDGPGGTWWARSHGHGRPAGASD
jgi:hypothetical protein